MACPCRAPCCLRRACSATAGAFFESWNERLLAEPVVADGQPKPGGVAHRRRGPTGPGVDSQLAQPLDTMPMPGPTARWIAMGRSLRSVDPSGECSSTLGSPRGGYRWATPRPSTPWRRPAGDHRRGGGIPGAGALALATCLPQ